MEKIFIKPAPGIKLFDPVGSLFIDPAGALVPKNAYWERRIVDGDAIPENKDQAAPAPAGPEKEAAAPAAPVPQSEEETAPAESPAPEKKIKKKGIKKII